MPPQSNLMYSRKCGVLIMPYKMKLTFESVDEVLFSVTIQAKAIEQYFSHVFCGAPLFTKFCKSCFRIFLTVVLIDGKG